MTEEDHTFKVQSDRSSGMEPDLFGSHRLGDFGLKEWTDEPEGMLMLRSSDMVGYRCRCCSRRRGGIDVEWRRRRLVEQTRDG